MSLQRLPKLAPVVTVLLALNLGSMVRAHPMLENGLDVVIGREQITVAAMISPEELLLTEAGGNGSISAEQRAKLLRQHCTYVAGHLHLHVDNQLIEPASVELVSPNTPADKEPSSTSLLEYRLRYVVTHPPGIVRIEQDFLREFAAWSAACVVRIRRADESTFDTALLARDKVIEFRCDWPVLSSGISEAHPSPPASSDIRTNVNVWNTARAFTSHGVMHILTGFDHLLFVSALVLAARGFWDLVKVVSAFTLAHTLTLALSVFNVVTLSERIVEPMIAASIVFVALQNLFWPNQSRGRTRLAVAFAFGLFHGLGFAGGLKEVMSAMPPVALWTALAAFSLGVEIGHQVVVVPLFALLQTARGLNAGSSPTMSPSRLPRLASCAICLAGVYFLVLAVRPM
ncbi:MAG: hypothetical protein JWL69_475 [Phycisphaerales bacterium]|nr:hypothetical protein [Phycisphaerales bacterium]